jgi:hypothetical protein
MFNPGDNLNCSNCHSRYSYKEKYPWFSGIVHMLASLISISISLYFSSWIVLLTVYFGITLIASYFYSSKKQLVPNGFRAKKDL